MGEFIILLFNEENIAGAWVAIAASIAFLGVVLSAVVAILGIRLNNHAENTRHAKEREHALIRETYFGGVEYLNHTMQKISIATSTGAVENDDAGRLISKKYYKLMLVASADVIKKLSVFSQKYSSYYMEICNLALEFKELGHQIDRYQQDIERSLEKMERVNNDREKADFSDEMMAFFESEFKDANDIFKSTAKTKDWAFLRKQQVHIQLLRKGVETMLAITPDLYDIILEMRNDLDRKLSEKDKGLMKKSFEGIQTQLQEDTDKIIIILEQKLDKLRNDLEDLS